MGEFGGWAVGGEEAGAQEDAAKGIVMAVSAYPYPLGKINTRQAVELIAATVYPHLKAVDGRKRVRERIRYARSQGKLSPAESFSAPEFFRWALDANPDWANLAQVQGLPRAHVIIAMSGHAKIGMTGKATLIVTPGDPQKLRDEFARVETERQKLVEEVADLKKRIAELEAEVAEWRERDRQMRAKRSAAGKRGGRGNTF